MDAGVVVALPQASRPVVSSRRECASHRYPKVCPSPEARRLQRDILGMATCVLASECRLLNGDQPDIERARIPFPQPFDLSVGETAFTEECFRGESTWQDVDYDLDLSIKPQNDAWVSNQFC